MEHVGDAGERRSVIVVDDDPDTRELLTELIGLLGHDVVGVDSGRAAIAACFARQPDVMFIDLGLPDIGGHEVAAELRASITTEPPLLVALTGRSQPRDIHRSFEVGIDLHFAKPIGMHVLRRVFATLSDGAGPARWAEGSGKWNPSQLGIVDRAKGG